MEGVEKSNPILNLYTDIGSRVPREQELIICIPIKYETSQSGIIMKKYSGACVYTEW